MDNRTLLALALLVATLLAITGAFFYATREQRGQRRSMRRGERARIRARAERRRLEEPT